MSLFSFNLGAGKGKTYLSQSASLDCEIDSYELKMIIQSYRLDMSIQSYELAMNSNMKQEFEVYQGDTGPIVDLIVPLEDGLTLDGDWTCHIALKETIESEDYEIPARTVTDKSPDNRKFRAFLTPSETEALEPGNYLIILQVENTTIVPPFRKEKHLNLKVLKQGL